MADKYGALPTILKCIEPKPYTFHFSVRLPLTYLLFCVCVGGGGGGGWTEFGQMMMSRHLTNLDKAGVGGSCFR